MAQANSRDADSFYVQDCRQVQNDTHTIQGLTGQISRLVGNLETEKDFERCRKMIDDSVRQTSETKVTLMRIREHQHQAQNVAESNNRRMMYTKLKDNLAITARVLEDVVRRYSTKEKNFRSDVGGPSDLLSGGSVSSADMAGGENQAMLAHFETELQGDQCQALRRVDEEMRCLQAIYSDLANAVEDQQTSLDTLESHMAGAADDVERGCAEVHQMAKYRQGKRKVLAMIGSGVMFVAVVSFFFAS
mmetsp:Transcript_115532/g.327381  ORF Transcript_115532/g.327381 Transcript_115532/m.327381 type:complete len:247 (+) Transcript_115532:88-828(+)